MIKYITPPCMLCKRTSTLVVDEAKLSAWQSGQLIQHAFPDLHADVREMIKTGTHPECWDALLGPED